MNEETVSTGSVEFTVEEIEVFEITDEVAFPNPACLSRKSRFARNPKKLTNDLLVQAHFLKENDRVPPYRRS
jgi:hypothetical protein